MIHPAKEWHDSLRALQEEHTRLCCGICGDDEYFDDEEPCPMARVIHEMPYLIELATRQYDYEHPVLFDA